MSEDMCRVNLTGRLTREAELRHTPSGAAVCVMRLAYSTRRKDPSTGEWGEKSNYIDAVLWGNRAEALAEHLTKGKQLGIDGRLEWREWDAQDGTKRQAYEIQIDNLVLLGGGGGANGKRDDGRDYFEPGAAATSTASGDFTPTDADSDIPF